MTWAAVWGWLKRVPLGVWAALGAAFALLELYLRGRRLEAELVQARLQQASAQARAGIAKNAGRAEVHLESARKAERRIEEVETARALANASGREDARRLSALSPDLVHSEYMKLLVKKRAALSLEESLKEGENLGKVTIKERRKSLTPPRDDR